MSFSTFLPIAVLVRRYTWGTAEAFNRDHSDLLSLRWVVVLRLWEHVSQATITQWGGGKFQGCRSRDCLGAGHGRGPLSRQKRRSNLRKPAAVWSMRALLFEEAPLLGCC